MLDVVVFLSLWVFFFTVFYSQSRFLCFAQHNLPNSRFSQIHWQKSAWKIFFLILTVLLLLNDERCRCFDCRNHFQFSIKIKHNRWDLLFAMFKSKSLFSIQHSWLLILLKHRYRLVSLDFLFVFSVSFVFLVNRIKWFRWIVSRSCQKKKPLHAVYNMHVFQFECCFSDAKNMQTWRTAQHIEQQF